MESTKCTSNMIVPEVLTEKNYEVWKIFMKNYLLGKGLWDIVEGSEWKPEPTNPGFKAWRMRNGEALHAIMISCGEKVLFPIRENDSAKDAWDHLASEVSIEQPAATYLYLTAEQAAARDLYRAVYLGDWEKTSALLGNGDSITATLSPTIGTVLQVAVATGNLDFVNQLLNFMELHAIGTVICHAALRTAALCGFTEIAQALVAKCRDALQFIDDHKSIPVVVASSLSHKDPTRFLYEETKKDALSGMNGATLVGEKNGQTLLNAAIMSDMYDIAIDLLVPHPELSIENDSVEWTTIKTLALRPNAFASGGHYSTCQQWIHSSINSINNKKKDQVKALRVLEIACSQMKNMDEPTLRKVGVYDSLFRAAKSGIVEIVSELAKINPELLFIKDKEDRSLVSIAILFRQEKIFNFLCQKRGYMTDLLIAENEKNGNTILHDAGKLSPLSQQGKIAGAALQMQRELQWFQAVEKIVPSFFIDKPNNEGLKPRDLFTKEHTELVKMGEKWMKDAANSCMIVATLIATVTFAAAFTVPGGDDQQWGYPIFLKRKLFLLFIISDALSLFSSSTSVLMFLSIYTSRYAEEDFLESLPKRLIIGLSTLFFSIATMMVAFCATIFLILHKHCKWAAILITVLAAVPVTFFFLLQFPLFLDMIRSTYGAGLFSSKGKRP